MKLSYGQLPCIKKNLLELNGYEIDSKERKNQNTLFN